MMHPGAVTVTDPDIVTTGPAAPDRPAPRADWRVYAIAGAALLLSLFALLTRPAAPAPAAPSAPVGSLLSISVAFEEGQPSSATAWFTDGTQRDISVEAWHRQWTPDRPVLMVTVASTRCTIAIGEDVVDDRAAPAGKLVTCVWRSPS